MLKKELIRIQWSSSASSVLVIWRGTSRLSQCSHKASLSRPSVSAELGVCFEIFSWGSFIFYTGWKSARSVPHCEQLLNTTDRYWFLLCAEWLCASNALKLNRSLYHFERSPITVLGQLVPYLTEVYRNWEEHRWWSYSSLSPTAAAHPSYFLFKICSFMSLCTDSDTVYMYSWGSC